MVDYNKAIALNPTNASFYEGRGDLKHFYFSDYRGAIADYSKAIELESLDVKISMYYLSRIDSKKMLKDYLGAIADYNILIELDPKSAYLYSGRAKLKDELEDYQGAIADHSKFIELNPNEVDVYIIRGMSKKNQEI
jgi:tetratricopeptide (TPR) repeat protein